MVSSLGVEAGTQFVQQVQEYVQNWISRAALPPELETMLVFALSQPGQVLATQKVARKSCLVQAIWAALAAPGYAVSVPVELAAGLELIISASDVIDDVQDGRLLTDPNGTTKEQWLNTALYMIFGGQAILDRLIVDANRLLVARNQFHEQVLRAIQGQCADLLQERTRVDQVDSQTALNVASLKSGSLVRGLFECTATLADVSPEVSRLTGEFGNLVGVIRQLSNDLDDLSPQNLLSRSIALNIQSGPDGRFAYSDLESIIRDSDIKRCKKTLPVAFALNLARHSQYEGSVELIDYYNQPPSALDQASYNRLADTIWNCGSPTYVELVLEMHRMQAHTLIENLVEAGYPAVSSWVALIA